MRLLEKVDDHKSIFSEPYEIRCPACYSLLAFRDKELTHDIVNLEIIDSKKYFPCPEITFRRFLSRKVAYPSRVKFYEIYSFHCLNCKNLVIVSSSKKLGYTYKKDFINYERLIKWINPLDTYDIDLINHNKTIYESGECLDFMIMNVEFEMKRSEFSNQFYTSYNMDFEKILRNGASFNYLPKEKASRIIN